MTQHFQSILEEVQQKWMDLEGVEAVGQGRVDGQDCIVVYLSTRNPVADQEIPAEYKTVPVQIRESGGRFEPQ